MAQAPRTFDAREPIEGIDAALTHTHENVAACKDTAAFLPPFVALLAQLDAHHATLRGLERVVSGLIARRLFLDDELNEILDRVRTLLEPRIRKTKDHEPEPWAVDMHEACFEGTKPTEARNHTLGPQVELQRAWETKLSTAPIPELVQAGVDNTPVIARADALATDIAKAEAALAQFLTGPWASFVDAANAAMKVVYAQLSELELKPPSGKPFPSGFVDRFILRDSTPRTIRPAELDGMIARLEARLAKLKGMRDEQQKRKQDDQRAKAQKALRDAQAEAAATQRANAEAAARLAKAQEELAKLDEDEGKTPPEK
jgi:hypothetical protein